MFRIQVATPILLAVLLSVCPTGNAFAGTAADDCRNDLDALPAYLLANDTGAAEHIRRQGQALFDDALRTARAAAAQVTSTAECGAVLSSYLHTYRARHLQVVPRVPPTDDKGTPPVLGDATRAPTFRVLSGQTSLITARSFFPSHAAAMVALVARHRDAITRRPNLIIDVRRNDGGSDSTYASLLPLVESNPYQLLPAEFLATSDNIAASERICAMYAPGPECEGEMRPVLSAMRNAQPGTYVQPEGSPRSYTVTPARALPRPARVAVMIDKHCGSSCEEFVLAARQSFKVKLFGRPTHGALDYSNLRPHRLPSGDWWLFYATSRSTRLPHFPVDGAGIPPDFLLPPPTDAAGRAKEIDTVRHVLEAAR